MTSSVSASSSGAGAPIQFSGLASGLDTASIISQLMAAEAAPQTALKNRMAAEQAQVTALQTTNTSLAALSTAAQSFTTGSTWTQLAATSSNANISVTATSDAIVSGFRVTVDQLAAAAQAVVTTPVGAGDTLDLQNADGSALTDSDGNPITIDSGDGSLGDIAAAINATTAKSNLRAVVVHGSGGADTLVVTSTQTGAASNFKIVNSNDGSTFADTSSGGSNTAGADGQITVGVGTGAGVTITSSSNTYTSVEDGVSITVGTGAAVNDTSQISVTDDGTSRATAVKAFVSQLNALVQSIASQTAYGAISTTSGQAATGAGALPGNSDLRDIASQLVNTIFPTDGSSLASYGLDIDENGNITFDSDKFTAAYQADPTTVQAAFTGPDGFAARVQKVADNASDQFDGTLTTTIKSMNSEISNYSDQITDWDQRLADKQASLEQTYANLETQLSAMQSQSSWLSGQLSSLDAGWAQNSSSSS